MKLRYSLYTCSSIIAKTEVCGPQLLLGSDCNSKVECNTVHAVFASKGERVSVWLLPPHQQQATEVQAAELKTSTM